MKYPILLLLMMLVIVQGSAKTWTVTSSGMTFQPSTLTINQGDSVRFTLDASHNAVEVSSTVWNANGYTSNGGFSVPFGGGLVLPAKLGTGTHYYVCTPHVSYGMKAKVVVQAATALSEADAGNDVRLITGPASGQFGLRMYVNGNSPLSLDLFDVQGKPLMQILELKEATGFVERMFQLPPELAPGVYLLRLTIGNHQSGHLLSIH